MAAGRFKQLRLTLWLTLLIFAVLTSIAYAAGFLT